MWSHLLVCGLLSLGLAGPGQSEEVELTLADGTTGTAELRAGDPDKPAILVLHGFLQTRDFATVRNLGIGLADEGYTVLMPTLGLGVDRRRQSLACEAIHTHSMESGAAEVALWIDWLQRHSGRPVIVIGHSAGSNDLLAYLEHHATSPAVAKAILISLAYFGERHGAFESEALAERARAELAAGRDDPGDYALAYCRSYVTLPSAFLSYYEWSRDRVLAATRAVNARILVILGQRDDRVDAGWGSALQQQGVNTLLVPGASHFFDQEHEFDLLDAVLSAIGEP